MVYIIPAGATTTSLDSREGVVARLNKNLSNGNQILHQLIIYSSFEDLKAHIKSSEGYELDIKMLIESLDEFIKYLKSMGILIEPDKEYESLGKELKKGVSNKQVAQRSYKKN